MELGIDEPDNYLTVIKLSIAIPTYDRNELLLEAVSALLPQLTSECRLIVLDNHSPTEVEVTLRALLTEYPTVDSKILRNSANIGANANILRCFELCETEWLWVLGDDDPVLPNAVATLLETIDSHPDLIYANYASEIEPRKQTFITAGVEEFAARLDHFGNALFISASLYNATKVRPHLNRAYHFTYSCAPHLLMVILALGKTGKCQFSDRQISRWEISPFEQQNSIVMVTIGLTTILEASLSVSVRRNLSKALIKASFGLRGTARELYYRAHADGDFPRARYLYDQLTYRLYYFERNPLMYLRIKLCRLSLMFPRLFGLINTSAARLTGRRIIIHPTVRRSE